MGFARQNRALAGIFAAALAVGVAGCGGSNTETSSLQTAGATGSSGSQAISKAAFIKQADSICAEANNAVKGLPVASTGASGNVTVSQQLGIVKGELQSLKSLGTPDSGGPQLNRFLAALEGEVAALQQESKTLQNGGDATISANNVDSATSSAQNAARAFGLQACAGSAAPAGTTTGGNGGTAGAGGTGGTATTVTPGATTPATPTPAPTPVPTPAPTPQPPAGGGTGLPTGGGGTGGSGGSGGGSGGVGVGP